MAATVAFGLHGAFRADDVLPPLRAGLATGDTISQGGDYFGPVDNLAAPATKLGPPDSVLVPESLSR
jgi:adenylate cyclase